MTMTVVNTYHVGYPDLDDLGAAFLTVLTRDERGQYSVYSGVVKLPDPVHEQEYKIARTLAAERVALRGNKESWHRAITFYPDVPKEEYRQ